MNFYRFINKIIVLFLSLLLLEGCDSWCNSSQKEELLVVLPAWPPDNSGNKSESQYPDYPKLIKWEICLCNSYEETIFYSNETSFTISVNKNEPFSVTATPITQAYKVIQSSDSGNASENMESFETSFFFPSGTVYPFENTENDIITLSWENGFLAECLRVFFKNGIKNGKSNSELKEFALKFNWKKAQNCINNNIQKSIIDENHAVYNPWLINSTRLLENLSNKKFYQSYFNLTNCFDFFLDEIMEDITDLTTVSNQENFHLFSRFIPENEYLYSKNKTMIKMDNPNFFSDGICYGIILNCNSKKIVSKEVIYLPIYHNRL